MIERVHGMYPAGSAMNGTEFLPEVRRLVRTHRHVCNGLVFGLSKRLALLSDSKHVVVRCVDCARGVPLTFDTLGPLLSSEPREYIKRR